MTREQLDALAKDAERRTKAYLRKALTIPAVKAAIHRRVR